MRSRIWSACVTGSADPPPDRRLQGASIEVAAELRGVVLVFSSWSEGALRVTPMAFLTSLLPGLREVRAPLVAGYMWVLFGWLLADPAAPDHSKGDLYDRLAQVGTAVGPVGEAVAASVLAYLVGSLITSVVMWLVDYGVSTRGRRFLTYGPLEERGSKQVTLDTVLEISGLQQMHDQPPGVRGALAGRLEISSLGRTLYALAVRELGTERRQLETAIERANKRAGGIAPVTPVRRGGPEFVIAFQVSEGDSSRRQEFVVPRFLPMRDFFAELPILRTRLVEASESTGMKVERIHSEAEFRFAVAVPLLALVILFSTHSTIWALALLAPLALCLQGFSLEREGDRQLLDALRARSETEELEKITPVFERYRRESYTLRNAIGNGVWRKV